MTARFSTEIISMILWIRTSGLSIKNSLSLPLSLSLSLSLPLYLSPSLSLSLSLSGEHRRRRAALHFRESVGDRAVFLALPFRLKLLFSKDPTEGLCLGPCGGPRGVGIFL